jgi:UDP-N-acetylmuramate: L-alanyl-gamma-D-glutamyl-meso-diaminopimelate ligase
VQKALQTFLGVKRRQEVRGVVNSITVVDDFAHHPTAVRLTIEAIRHQYKGARVWAVFEPRSFTARSSRFQDAFGPALSAAERVILAPAFQPPKSELKQCLNTRAIADQISQSGGWALAAADTDEILASLVEQSQPGDVVLIMSNGGFDALHERLLAGLEERYQLRRAAP